MFRLNNAKLYWKHIGIYAGYGFYMLLTRLGFRFRIGHDWEKSHTRKRISLLWRHLCWNSVTCHSCHTRFLASSNLENQYRKFGNIDILWGYFTLNMLVTLAKWKWRHCRFWCFEVKNKDYKHKIEQWGERYQEENTKVWKTLRNKETIETLRK